MKLNKIELFWWDIGNVCNVPIREDSGWVLNGGYLEISRQTGIKVLFVAEVPFAAAKYLEVIGSSDPERALVIGSPIRTPSSIFTF